MHERKERRTEEEPLARSSTNCQPVASITSTVDEACERTNIRRSFMLVGGFEVSAMFYLACEDCVFGLLGGPSSVGCCERDRDRGRVAVNKGRRGTLAVRLDVLECIKLLFRDAVFNRGLGAGASTWVGRYRVSHAHDSQLATYVRSPAAFGTSFQCLWILLMRRVANPIFHLTPQRLIQPLPPVSAVQL